MKKAPITPQEYLASRIEAKPALDLHNELRFKAYQMRCGRCGDDPDALPHSIAQRAQQGLRFVLNMQLREYRQKLRTKRLSLVKASVPVKTKKAASA